MPRSSSLGPCQEVYSTRITRQYLLDIIKENTVQRNIWLDDGGPRSGNVSSGERTGPVSRKVGARSAQSDHVDEEGEAGRGCTLGHSHHPPTPSTILFFVSFPREPEYIYTLLTSFVHSCLVSWSVVQVAKSHNPLVLVRRK